MSKQFTINVKSRQIGNLWKILHDVRMTNTFYRIGSAPLTARPKGSVVAHLWYPFSQTADLTGMVSSLNDLTLDDTTVSVTVDKPAALKQLKREVNAAIRGILASLIGGAQSADYSYQLKALEPTPTHAATIAFYVRINSVPSSAWTLYIIDFDVQ